MAYATGGNPDLRVSDAERDAAAAELGQHFRDGRLDHAEFDQRITAAMVAKTRGNLAELLTDLPQAGVTSQAAGPQGRSGGRPGALMFLPVALAALFITAAVTGGWHHAAGGWPYAPFGFLWLVVPVIVIRMAIRGSRRRQWR
jgi:hypothetical protein